MNKIRKLYGTMKWIPPKNIEQILIKAWKTKEFIDWILEMHSIFENISDKWIPLVTKEEAKKILSDKESKNRYFSNQVKVVENSKLRDSFDSRIAWLSWQDVMVLPHTFAIKNGISTVQIMPLNRYVDDNNPIFINIKFLDKKTLSDSLKKELELEWFTF